MRPHPSGNGVGHPFASIFESQADTTLHATTSAEWGTPSAARPNSRSRSPSANSTTSPRRTRTHEPDAHLAPHQQRAIATGAPCANGAPGGFGWLDGTNCSSTISIDATVPAERTGIQPNLEQERLLGERAAHEALPDAPDPALRGDTPAAASSATFTISRFAAFKLTGRQDRRCERRPERILRGLGALRRPIPAPPGNSKGIQGYFVKYVELGEDFELGEGPDGGLSIVRLID